jgi:hypothetical protein
MQLNSYTALVALKLLIPSTRSPYLAIEKHFLTEIMGFYIEKIRFDDFWYMNQYPDVIEGIASGDIDGPKDHYLRYGYFEGRLPYEIIVDEPWYLSTYPDIPEAIKNKVVSSGQDHFIRTGYREGRLPFEGFRFETAESVKPVAPPKKSATEPARQVEKTRSKAQASLDESDDDLHAKPTLKAVAASKAQKPSQTKAAPKTSVASTEKLKIADEKQ